MKFSIPQNSKPSLIKHADGEFYTRYFSNCYDFLTTLSGWRKKIACHALNNLPKNSSRNLLDVGCGTGFLMSLARQNGFNIHGLDASHGMLEKAKQKYGFKACELTVASADNMPFADNSFDVTVASGSLVHIPNVDMAAREMIRVTKKNGTIRIVDHTWPVKSSMVTLFFTLFSQLSGDILHNYPQLFADGCELMNRKTLGRGGYMQCFDFKKL